MSAIQFISQHLINLSSGGAGGSQGIQIAAVDSLALMGSFLKGLTMRWEELVVISFTLCNCKRRNSSRRPQCELIDIHTPLRWNPDILLIWISHNGGRWIMVMLVMCVWKTSAWILKAPVDSFAYSDLLGDAKRGQRSTSPPNPLSLCREISQLSKFWTF